jgi:uncharacterized membrane-anchored protein YjiN (DUF445 family)
MDTAAFDIRQQAQAAALRRHRAVASVCLLLAAAVYIATQFVPQPGYWLLLLRAGAEAGLIGGIADWFAVTALFRRPLGLPIPHTAIIPRNKDRIGEGLGAFVERNFLDPQLIADKLRQVDPAARLADWLARAENAEVVAQRVVAVAPYLLDSLEDRETRAFFRDAFSRQLREADLVPLLVRVMEFALAGRQHQQLFDRALRVAREQLAANEGLIYEKVEARSSWWVPRRFDRRLAQAIVQGLEEWLSELAEPEHPLRLQFDQSARELAQRLQESESFRRRLDSLKAQLLESEELQRLLETIWDQIRAMITRSLADPASGLSTSLAASLRTLGRTLQADDSARGRMNRRLEALLGEIVAPFRRQIGAFISEVVRGWDARTVSARLELEVGRDLQYIRINGTLVGALVGCVLFVLTRLAFGA